jgi:hypothetical protein
MRKTRVVYRSVAFVGTSLALYNVYVGVDSLDKP